MFDLKDDVYQMGLTSIDLIRKRTRTSIDRKSGSDSNIRQRYECQSSHYMTCWFVALHLSSMLGLQALGKAMKVPDKHPQLISCF